jgi:hypothetical protein
MRTKNRVLFHGGTFEAGIWNENVGGTQSQTKRMETHEYGDTRYIGNGLELISEGKLQLKQRLQKSNEAGEIAIITTRQMICLVVQNDLNGLNDMLAALALRRGALGLDSLYGFVTRNPLAVRLEMLPTKIARQRHEIRFRREGCEPRHGRILLSLRTRRGEQTGDSNGRHDKRRD